MAEDTQPSNVQEGIDPPDVLPANAEDRKAAQALSSLDVKGDYDGSTAKKEVDLKALGEAMKNLDMSQTPKKSTDGQTKKDEAPKKLVKVDPADVAIVVRIQVPSASPSHLVRSTTLTSCRRNT